MVFKFPLLVALLPFIVTGAIVAGGAFCLYLRKISLGVILVVGGLALMIVVRPSMLLDRVEVTDERVWQSTGFWYSPTEKGFRFADVESVNIDYSFEGPVSNEIWEITRKDGRRESLDPGDLWAKHTDEIVEIMRDKGIEVIRRK